MPLVETAARMPCAPYALKPFAAPKLEAWKLAMASTKIVSSGIATFHHVAALLAAARRRIPRKLMLVSSAIRKIATMMPLPVRTLVFGSSQPLAKE